MLWTELFNKKKDATGESINMESSKEQEIKPEQKEESYDVDFYIENLLKFRKVYDEIEEGQTYYNISWDSIHFGEYIEIEITEKIPITQIEDQFKQFAKKKHIRDYTRIPFAKSKNEILSVMYNDETYYSWLYKEKIDFLPKELRDINGIKNLDICGLHEYLNKYLIASVKLGVHNKNDINQIIIHQVVNKARKSLVGDVIWIPPYDRQHLHKLINGYLLMIDEKPALIYTEDELDSLSISERMDVC